MDVTDKDDIHIRHYIEKTYHYRNDKAVRDAMQIVATENEYHPVRNWLKSLEWDGTERVRYALPHFLGTSGSDYEYECLKLFMLGAISRVFKPGCKFEYMLCLVGGQEQANLHLSDFCVCRTGGLRMILKGLMMIRCMSILWDTGYVKWRKCWRY